MTVTIDDIQNLVAVQLGRRRAAPQDLIVEDLGAESLDVVNIIAAVEDRYRIRIEEAELPDVRTVEDLFALVQSRRPGGGPAPG